MTSKSNIKGEEASSERLSRVVRSPFETVIENTDMYSSYMRTFDLLPHKTAFVDTSTGQSITYAQLRAAAERLASRLYHDFTLRRGDRVAVYSANSIQFEIVVLAALRLGATIVTINHLSTASELRHYLQTAPPLALVSDAQRCSAAFQASKGLNLKVITTGGSHSGMLTLSALLDPAETRPPLPPISSLRIDPMRDVALINFSSGTSGLPKAVMTTHANFAAILSAMRHPVYIQKDAYTLIYQPMSHIFGFGVCNNCMHEGTTVLLMTAFDMETYLKNVQDHKIEILYLVPPIVNRLVKENLTKNYDLSAVKRVITASAPLGASTEAAFRGLFTGNQPSVVQETSGIVTHSPLHLDVLRRDWDIPPTPSGSVGLLFPNMEALIVDMESGRSLGPNEDGEIWTRGPVVMLGYYGNEPATRETIDAQGWLHTGDVGHYDKNGYFFIVGRIKELIKYKSFQVAPAELEALILRHPDVDDVGVVGVPDSDAGELPQAWVVVKPGHSITTRSIVDWVQGQAALYKWLRGGVKFVESIPRNPTGKILRRRMCAGLPNSAKL